MSTLPNGGDMRRPLVGVAEDDDGHDLFWGIVEYADGGYLGIRRADSGDVQEWPSELVRIEAEVRR